ncbi:MAG: DNA mismatch repair protein MutT [Phormidesmis priestleyi]|uniref:DNA mismatch repair protein MutT n=1 Tax=Phormidesmis priestleyi TaxID=268141 RepID=A0A2W4XUN4_9CYAN|nr:MAG: DNA mismatch repair protein MutT [Phormidesmis priestleyi]
MKFKSTPNQCLHIEGKELWISRSVTVLPVLFFVTDGVQYVPLGLRGADLPEGVGQWGLPGGYLDYDETATQAVCREVWEELGLDIPQLIEDFHFEGNLDQPYAVYSTPLRRQNVTLKYALMFHLDKANLPPLAPQVSKGEVVEARWFKVEEALTMPLAFNHHEVMQDCLSSYYA